MIAGQRASCDGEGRFEPQYAAPEAAVLPLNTSPSGYRLSSARPPHIYSDREIRAVNDRSGTSPIFLRITCPSRNKTLIGLLASTGLRPQEALALNKADVDLETGILSIRQTKFRKIPFRSCRRLDSTGSGAVCKTT